ncbi:MAG: hypothetical protein LBM98_11945 [Oscillospiraceae bacterium]|jgi:hypothetical protein|nr:hypothetical protein [Oscillospiraceae bacterium]
MLITFLIISSLGFGAVQIFLSRSERGGLGLILPIISFVVATFFALGLTYWNPFGEFFDKWLKEFSTLFLLFNIPTAVLATVYIFFRLRIKKRRAIAKMNAQDL